MQLVIMAASALLGFAEPTPARNEIVRVQAHLDGALALLSARDLAGLTTAQRTRRARLVRELQDYRDRGAFPLNRDFPGRLVPYFVDPVTGVHCAVGHLMAFTGETELVAEVVRTDNHVRVPALADHAAFRRWLDANGLTIEEAARIQPQYGGPWPPVPVEPPHVRNRTQDVAVTSAAVLLGGFSWTTRSSDGARWPALVGTAVGAYAFGRGTHFSFNGETYQRDASVMAALGAFGTAISWSAYREMRAGATRNTAARRGKSVV